MALPQALVEFEGLVAFESFAFTMGHGISPGQGEISILPQDPTIPPIVDIRLTFGEEEIVLNDCLIDSASYQYDQSGQIIALRFMDRRWQWQRFGKLSGRYNLRQKDFKIVKDKEKQKAAVGDAIADCERTPQELAELCLEAMGETDFDVSDLPNDARPTVDWDGVNPAEALADLCESLACRVVLQLDDTVAIRRAGIGAEVPNGFVEALSESLNPPEKPSKLIILCAKNRYQDDLPLEAVGMDLDGEWKLVDDLSYKPPNGWTASDIHNMIGLTDATADGRAKIAAKKTVGRCYRIKTPLEIEGYEEKIIRLRQILPIEDEMVEQAEIMGTKKNKLAFVYGVFDGGLVTQANTEDKIPAGVAGNVVPFTYSVDTEHGIVKFDDVVIKQSAPGGAANAIAFAELKLRTAVSIRDPETGAWIRHERSRKLSTDSDTMPRYVKHDEIILTTARITKETNTNDSDGVKKTETKTVTNKSDVNKECDYYLDALEKEYRTDRPVSVLYIGLMGITLDGALQSVTWTIDGSVGGSTRLTRNDDIGSRTTLPYNIVRANQKAAAAAEKVKELENWKNLDLAIADLRARQR